MDGNRRVAEDGARVNVRPAASGECCSLETRRPASFVGHRLMQTSNISKCLPLSIRFVEEIALNDVPPAHLVFSEFHFLTFSKNENIPFRCKWTRICFRLMTRRPTLSVRAASNPFCSASRVLNDVPPAALMRFRNFEPEVSSEICAYALGIIQRKQKAMPRHFKNPSRPNCQSLPFLWSTWSIRVTRFRPVPPFLQNSFHFFQKSIRFRLN